MDHPKGRATGLNPKDRFEPFYFDRDDADLVGDEQDGTEPSVATEFLVDSSRSVLAENASPDIGFRFSLNPYRGCEHGCVYCYARPSHEFLGWSAGIDFESRILIKTNAPELLDRALSRPSWEPQTVALSGNTDCYQPLEKRLELTRRCLTVFPDHGNPVGIITKSFLVTRDLDLLCEMAQRHLVAVTLSVTTLSAGPGDAHGAAGQRPRRAAQGHRTTCVGRHPGRSQYRAAHSRPERRRDSRHPQGLSRPWSSWASYILLRLPGAVQPIFVDWVRRHYPDRADKVLNQLRAMRGGGLSDPRFGTRMSGTGKPAKLLKDVFSIHKTRLGYTSAPRLATDQFRRVVNSDQLELSFY